MFLRCTVYELWFNLVYHFVWIQLIGQFAVGLLGDTPSPSIKGLCFYWKLDNKEGVPNKNEGGKFSWKLRNKEFQK